MNPHWSWYEATARQRLAGLLDPDSFVEFVGPEARETSPHLPLFDLPVQFDDGMIVGHGRLDAQRVWVAAQEGRFMGGACGEVHGAKLTGLLRAARETRSMPVILLLDTGGVRLQEANAGELAVAEIMRVLIEARLAGVPVVALIGGRAGCFGGGGLIAGCCSAIAVSEQGRISVSGPEVIETNRGVEEFDSRDRALVWRTMGGKHRRLSGGADFFADDSMAGFRSAARSLLERAPLRDGQIDGTTLEAEQARLEQRLARCGECADALDVWSTLGAPEPQRIAAMAHEDFLVLADALGAGHAAR